MKNNRIIGFLIQVLCVGISLFLIFMISIISPFETWSLDTKVLNDDNIVALQFFSFLGIAVNVSAVIAFRKTRISKSLFIALMLYFIYKQFAIKNL